MSGGSFNYLCYMWDIGDLYDKRGELEPMAQTLIERYDADDAAKETYEIIYEMRALEARLKAHLERLRPVWKAVEWHTSCDWGREDVLEALAKYRGLETKESKK